MSNSRNKPVRNQMSYHDLRPQLRPYFIRNKNEIYPFNSINNEPKNIEVNQQRTDRYRITENDNDFRTCNNDNEDLYQNQEGIILNDLRDIKENISEMKKELKNANLTKLKNDISEIKQNNKRNEEIKNEIKELKEEIQIIKNLLMKNKDFNETLKNVDKVNNNELFEIIPDRTIVIQMNMKNYILKIHPRITLKEIIINCKKFFKLPNEINLIIHYFNEFGIKYFINNEEDFRKSLDDKAFLYYLNEDKNSSNKLNGGNKISEEMLSNRGNIKEKNELYDSDNDNDNDNDNNRIKEDDDDENYYDSYNFDYANGEKTNKELKEIIAHFASLAQEKTEEKIEYFLNSADCISDFMKKYNSKKKEKAPKKFINIDDVIKKPGLLLKGNDDKNDFDFILSLIGEILKDKNIDLNILKNNNEEENNKDKLSEACLQYLFCGLLDKKKIEINFKFAPRKIDTLNKKKEELSEFIEEWKEKISNLINIDKKDISLINPKKKGKDNFSLDLVSKDDTIFQNQNKILSNYKEINYIREKSFIESCQLNNNIFDSKYNNQDGFWGLNEKRGGEFYIPPIGWKGYGLKVDGKYDHGDNTWLDYNDRKGVFAVAYLGLSNIFENKEKSKKYLSEINLPEILKMNYQQTYKNDNDLRNQGKKCGCGIYLFQNPKIAENSAGIIDVIGIRYKVLLMCRVNPKKIRQPEGYQDCWILNPSPDEIRPYRILVKTILNSPLAVASQEEIKIFTEPSEYYKDIIDKKDNTFYEKNKTNLSNSNYVIELYTSPNYKYINGYLREGKVTPGPYTEEEIKSWVWCLHDSLTKMETNVPNSSILFRGVGLPFPENIGIGSKFIFGEFFSTTKSLKLALTYYSGYKTLFIIRIENNNVPPGFYCCNIEDISLFDEKETLITSNCVFEITNKGKKIVKQLKEEFPSSDLDNSIDENKEVLVVYITCLGNYYDNKNNNNTILIRNENI